MGVMFAPHDQASADELVRVTRPGGTIGLLGWTPDGFIGQVFATMRPYVAPPPPDVQPPPWGRREATCGRCPATGSRTSFNRSAGGGHGDGVRKCEYLLLTCRVR